VDSVYRAILARACAEPQRCAEVYMHKLLPSLAEAIAIANLAVLLCYAARQSSPSASL